MATLIDGLIDGCRAAEDDFGIRCSLIADVYRQDPPDVARQMVEEVIARCRDQGVHFTCCPTSTAVVYGWPDLTTHPINGMMAAWLKVMLNSDDPTMFHTDIGKEYVDFCGQNDYRPDVVRRLVHNGIEACWLDDGEKAALRRSFDAGLGALEAELESRP